MKTTELNLVAPNHIGENKKGIPRLNLSNTEGNNLRLSPLSIISPDDSVTRNPKIDARKLKIWCSAPKTSSDLEELLLSDRNDNERETERLSMLAEDSEPQSREEKGIFVMLFAIKLFLVIVVCLILCYSFFNRNGSSFLENATSFLLNANLKGFLIFYVCFFLAGAIFFPMEPFIVSMGFVFSNKFGLLGYLLALLASVSGTICSAFLAFSFSRYLCYNAVQLMFGRKRWFTAFNRAVRDGGITFVCLLRLSPIVPFAASNYLLGLTDLRYRDLIVGTTACAPLQLIFVIFGSYLSNIHNASKSIDDALSISWKHKAFAFSAFFFTVVAVIYISYQTKKKIDEALQMDPTSSVFNFVNPTSLISTCMSNTPPYIIINEL